LTSSTSMKSKAKLKDAVALAEASEIVGLDIETTGLNPRKDRIRSFQVSNGKKTYVVDAFKTNARPLAEALTTPKTVITHGGKFEWGFIYHGFGIALANLVDTYLLARLAASGDMSVPCGLGDVAKRLLGIELDKDMQQADWTTETLSRRHLVYAATDAAILPRLYEKLTKEIAATGQERIAEIENRALPAFAGMGYVGMPVDKEAWDAQAQDNEAKLRNLEREMLDAIWMPERDPIPQTWAMQGEDCLAMLHAVGITDVTGTTAKDLEPHKDHDLVAALLAYRRAKGEERDHFKARVLELAPEKPPKAAPPWNFGSSQQVAEIAYKILGFELRSTEEGTLLRYKNWHPFFEHTLKHRELKKLVSTYGKNWFQKAYNEETGRVYPAWRQIGTSTGRVASGEKSTAPNAQNLPKSHRKFFVAPEGRTFVDADYSQIEVRILAKMLNEENLLSLYGRPSEANEKPSDDVYRATAAHMLEVEPDAVTKDQRDLAKAIVLGMNYGLSARGLPYYAFTKLGIEDMSTDDAEEYVEAFYDLYPKIRTYHEGVLDELDEEGSVDQRTLTGRLRAGITNRNEAINAPIQGTSADILKLAMASIYERLKNFEDAIIVASIHDELLIECDENDAEAVAGVVKDAMLEAANKILNAEEPKVKVEVDVAINKRWTKG
jgi:DNA polymerase I-like protein with 3'-5' exonuclease and polymerase domains